MRIENEPANVCFLQDELEIARISAFREPKPSWLCPKKIDINIASDQNLCSAGLERLEQWEQGMRGGGGNNFERAGFPQLAKSSEQITFAFIHKETPAFRK